MLLVRRTLTEILLEVTNEEISIIATETLARARKKGSLELMKNMSKTRWYIVFDSLHRIEYVEISSI